MFFHFFQLVLRSAQKYNCSVVLVGSFLVHLFVLYLHVFVAFILVAELSDLFLKGKNAIHRIFFFV